MLEIGSIVLLKEGKQKLMLLNRTPIIELNNEKQYFDYSACGYPLGMVANQIVYFNEENIDKVLFNGFHDEDENKFEELYKNWLKSNKNQIKKGMVTQKDE